MRKEATRQNINEIRYEKIQNTITNVYPKFILKRNFTKAEILQTKYSENTKILGTISNTQSKTKGKMRKTYVIALKSYKQIEVKI